MANRLQKTPRLVYTPAVQAVPGRAAYCESRQVVQSASGFSFASMSSGGYQPSGRIPDGWDGVADANGYGTSYSPLRPVTRTETICYPAIAAVAAVPARMDQTDNAGWNAGGRSVRSIPSSGFFRATMPALPVGIQIGFSGRSYRASYEAMSHSVVVRAAQCSIVELGRAVFGPFEIPVAAVIEVQRRLGVVSYLVNGDVVYQSQSLRVGETYGAALLYSPTDSVDSPAIGSIAQPLSFDGAVPIMVAAVDLAGDMACVRGKIPAIELSATLNASSSVLRFAAAMPALRCAISVAANDGVADLRVPSPMVISVRVEALEQMPAGMAAVLPPPALEAYVKSGRSLSFDAATPGVIGALGAAPYSQVMTPLRVRVAMHAEQPYMPAGESDGSDAVYAEDSSVLETVLLMVALDSLEVSSEASLTLVLELAAHESLEIGDDASIGWLVEMLSHEHIAVHSTAHNAKQQALQYAVNYMTGALSTYKDFDFIGFTRHEGASYGFRADGLYVLGGDHSGVVNALVDFGASDYGDAHLKRMAMAFVGVRTDGECYLRLCADGGREQVYKLIGGEPQSRAMLAKGVSGRTWNVRLELQEASYASVDNIELEVGVSQRRGYSGRR